MSIEIKIKRIDWRNWGDIKSQWISNLPIIDPPGEPPILEVCELIGIEDLTEKIPKDGELHDVFEDLREAIFREAIFLLHKSISVTLTPEFCIMKGIKTWSISASYHACLFAAKSILCFLGITLPRINNVDYLFDIFPKPEKLSKSQLRKGRVPIQKMKFLKMFSLNHYKIWLLFQRAINVSNVECWNENLVNYLKNLEPSEFALQRNILHYKNNSWFLDDLFAPVFDEKFAKCERVDKIFNEYSSQSNFDFTIILSFLLLNMSYSLLEDIANDAPILLEEFNLIKNNLNNTSYALYNTLIS